MRSLVFIIGAQRSGTTYLYSLLDAHPEIEMIKPVRPEPKFFLKDEEWLNGPEYYLKRYFERVSPEVKVLGEKTTSYLEYDFVAIRIRDFFPESKILVILRNPVERAVSNYNFSVQNGLETRSLEDVFLNDIPAPIVKQTTSVSPFAYVERGEYAKFLAPYRIFGKQLKILILEELLADPSGISEVYNFLEVKEYFMPSNTQDRVNESESQSVPPEIMHRVKHKLRTHYQPHNSVLEELMGRKIMVWNDKI